MFLRIKPCSTLLPFLYRLSLVVVRHRREGECGLWARSGITVSVRTGAISRGWCLFVPQPQRITDMTASERPPPRRHPAPERGGSRRIWTPHQSLPRYVPRASAFCWKARRSTGGGTLQHSGLRLPASGHLPGRAAVTRHQRRPSAPLPRSTGCPSRKAYARSCTACTSKTRGHHAAAHHPRPVRHGYFGYGMASFFNKS